MSWFIAATKNYATFSGRARRSEYWYFVLFYLIIIILLAAIDGIIGTFSQRGGIGVFSGLFALGMFIPAIAVTVRRLHDSDRSGWWFLIGFIPLVGGLILLVFCVLESTAGENRFGDNPLAAAKRMRINRA